MKKPETKFKEKMLKDLRALPKTWCAKIQQVSLRGTPDVLACINSFFVAFELKASENAKVDELQRFTLECIRNANGGAFIVYPENWEATLEWIQTNLIQTEIKSCLS